MAVDLNTISQLVGILGSASNGGSQVNPNASPYAREMAQNQATGNTLDEIVGMIPAVGQVYGVVNTATDLISDAFIDTPSDGVYDSNVEAGFAEVLDGATHVANAANVYEASNGNVGKTVLSALLPGYGGAYMNNEYKKKKAEALSRGAKNKNNAMQSNYEATLERDQYAKTKAATPGMTQFAMGGPLTTGTTDEIGGQKHSRGGTTIKPPTQDSPGIQAEKGEFMIEIPKHLADEETGTNFIFSDQIPYKS